MKEVLLFLNQYYNFYFFLFIFVVMIFITFNKQKMDMQGIRKQSVILLCSFIEALFLALLMKNHNVPFFRETEHPFFYSFVFEAILAVLSGLLLVKVNNLLVCLLIDLEKSSFFTNNKYGVTILALLLIHFLLNMPSEINIWVECWYAVDYSMGIGSRFFVGSILSLICGDYIKAEEAYLFCAVCIIFLCIIVAYMLNNLIKESDGRIRRAVCYLVICFLASPGSVMGLWTKENFGRLETYTLLIDLIAVMCMHKIKNVYIKYAVVTVMSCVSMAIYQGDVFLYYPILLMVILYDGFYSENRCMRNRLLGLGNVLLTGITFVFFQFFSFTIYQTPQELADVVARKSNIRFAKDAVRYELFESVDVAFKEINMNFLMGAEMPREKTFITIVCMIPLIVIFVAIYMKCFSYINAKNISYFKTPYLYFVLCNLFILPQFILNVDWGRWMMAITIVAAFGIFYLVYQKEQTMHMALEKLSIFLKENSFATFIIIIYLAMLDKFEARGFISQVDRLSENFFALVGFGRVNGGLY